MKSISRIITTLALILSAVVYAEDDEKSPLAKEMDSMATVFKKIDRATRKGKIDDKEDLVAAAKQLKESFIKSKNLIPPMVADMLDGDDKTKMIAEYKKAIDESISLCDKLIKNLEEEDVAAAKATIKELKKGRRSGHDKYQPEDE